MKNKLWLMVITASVFSSVITFILVTLFYIPPLSAPLIQSECRDGVCADADAIQIALQLGRLDIVSLCLAVLGISVALFAIIGFFAVKEKAELEAKGAAERVTMKWLSESAPAIVGQHVSDLLDIYEEGMGDKTADGIAGAFAEENGSNPVEEQS